MSKIKDGGPAFPALKRVGIQDCRTEGGLTVRDYFAAKAMQGLCANDGYNQHSPGTLANEAYGMADAMLKAREA